MKNIIKDNKGVTLIELMLTIAIMIIVLQVIYSLFYVGNKSFNISKNKGFAQQDVRIASDFINKELRTAKEISKTDNLTGKYYSLALQNGKILKKTYNSTEKDLLLSNNLSKITFKYIDTDQKGLLNLTIAATEAENNQNKQEYDLNINILLENLPDYNINMDQDIIYYSKHE